MDHRVLPDNTVWAMEYSDGSSGSDRSRRKAEGGGKRSSSESDTDSNSGQRTVPVREGRQGRTRHHQVLSGTAASAGFRVSAGAASNGLGDNHQRRDVEDSEY